MQYHEIVEGRVYQVDGGYPQPVPVISNPSATQARTLVQRIAARDGYVYLRGLLDGNTVYVWDGWHLTHDDVIHRLLRHDDYVHQFEIANYSQESLLSRRYHAAKVIGADVSDIPFVRNVMAAIDALPPPKGTD